MSVRVGYHVRCQPDGGLMPGWCGEVGGNPALSRNRDHISCVEVGVQITCGEWFLVPSGVTDRHRRMSRLCCPVAPLGTLQDWGVAMAVEATTTCKRVVGPVVAAALMAGAVG